MSKSDPLASPVRRALLDRVLSAPVDRAYRPLRREPGDRLQVEVTGIHPQATALVSLELERFIGGGFAGQVYQARILTMDGPIAGLDVGGTYAVKILRPPSGFSLAFRNALYKVAYQADFSAQVNRSAVLAGAMWQKLLRRGMAIETGSERSVVDVHGIFFDETLRSWGEISEWVPGRNWMLEIDDRLLERRKHRPATWDAPQPDVPSPEFLHKRAFMARVVRTFHAMGAHELARQYEWWSLKSQPNALKRLDAGPGPADGLTAIDFRAGLALLFFLPMSPIDFVLIWRGLLRGRLAQFDRGDVGELKAWVERHRSRFTDLLPLVPALETQDAEYRASLPDVLHHRFRLLTDRDLRTSIREAMVRDWLTLEKVDDTHAERLNTSLLAFWLFLLLGLVPLLGDALRKLWGHDRKRNHILKCLGSMDYLKGTLRMRQWEHLVEWHRAGRLGDADTTALADRPGAYYAQRVLLSWMPAGLHRFFAEPAYFWTRFKDAVTYPVRLYFKAQVREEWLLEQVELAKAEGMLDAAEEKKIRASIQDPFVQTYLMCVAVHFCTLPVTQVVSVLVAVYYYFFQAADWKEGMAMAAGILAAFQATPISPGSLTRGAYTFYRMIRDRNVKNYWVAAIISFWHYIGYLAFPIQMVAWFPGLARFMGGTWATRMARIIPVFGEKGALLEHFVFDCFFNVPLSLKRAVTRKG